MLFKKNKIILFVLVAVIFIYVSYKNDSEIFNKKISHQKTNYALTSTSNPSEICKEYKATYPYLDKLKLEVPIQLRFENTHLKINNKIYRLRHFFKDGDEGEIETFLVYLEDQNEDAHIIEKSSYHKGKFYSDILKMENTIIYHEEGITLADNTIEPLFLHYINNNLIGTRGKKSSNSPDKEIDCRF